ncbi:MAG: SUMF1/EgtB/PvdO family nonheme iron enzyme [Balneolaceae bacterium]|nr:SUMF1/EgtB/PvdO family nonheme iron enzyme [Balneolaceae bacterium]MBO6546558.1 SUMF1/EgtB/PvdO family nonheme iron enzyme [Balneolaceae bacterium]MBO6648917.1 SUMF1/EgtB/PvdO family nonheme iron enzyme [Balneolaceae bacterium]
MTYNKSPLLKLIFLLLFTIGLAFNAKSSDLKLSTPILYLEGDSAFAVFNVSWKNAWHNDKNYDAVWLFFKSIPREGQAHHISILPDSHIEITTFSDRNTKLSFDVTEDSTGLFIYPSEEFRGNISATLKISLERDQFYSIRNRASSFRVFGIEMVNIPKGSFVLGEPGEDARQFGSFYNPTSSSLPELSEEKTVLEVRENGSFYYQNHEGYEGDQTGIIPADFPKGVSSFYVMKYEITESQYVSFLNSLKGEMLSSRDIINTEYYNYDGGSITLEEGRYSTKHPNKPAILLSWKDMMGFADWAALRPMTEFEFTKAARGNRKPISGELPWGNSNKYGVQRLPDTTGELHMNNSWTEDMLSQNTLSLFGASYYWVMDLSGSLWERMVTVGHPNGRTFIGTHGDGLLSEKGEATNKDWPSGEIDAGGVGFRGGGFYGYTREYHEYNPFSPIAYRPYGAWHGVDRGKAYGGRLVRTAN